MIPKNKREALGGVLDMFDFECLQELVQRIVESRIPEYRIFALLKNI